MPYFPWKAEYSVSVREIDAQHRHLVDLINQLYDAMSVGQGKAAVEKLLNELIDYTRTHFSAEEHIMQVNAYPDFIAHLSEHTRLISQVLEYQQKWKAGEQVTVALSKFLKDWLTSHILTTDMKYSPYLNARGVK